MELVEMNNSDKFSIEQICLRRISIVKEEEEEKYVCVRLC